ncbi:ABC transporter substrate-binding protein [Marinospirillum sp.]|uniref:ABC transporter substrate-binding protein n=1 Tax=Marinospirillum sp. TaxID=2183934 RepID=UPI0025B9108B|nr:ABC transporter substrate-binding protein [Marinospirillum sp.]
MSKKILRRAGFLAATLAAGIFAGAQAAEPIKIGSFLSVTGPASFLGDPELKTLEMYVERINQSGGVLGRPLQLIHYDDAGDASAARNFASRLVRSDRGLTSLWVAVPQVQPWLLCH